MGHGQAMASPWFQNDGHLPEIARGKHVEVELRDGRKFQWPADDKAAGRAGMGARWDLQPEHVASRRADIVKYRVL